MNSQERFRVYRALEYVLNRCLDGGQPFRFSGVPMAALLARAEADNEERRDIKRAINLACRLRILDKFRSKWGDRLCMGRGWDFRNDLLVHAGIRVS